MHPPSAHDRSVLPTSVHHRTNRLTRSFFHNPFSSTNTTSTSTTTSRSPSSSPALSTSAFARTTRSPSSSISSNSFFSSQSRNPSISSLADILALSYPASRNKSLESTRRPSCYSILEMQNEREEFGESCVGVLEPRPGQGWWGVTEVLEEEEGSRRGSLS